MDFVWIPVICGILGFATVIYFARYVLRQPSGTKCRKYTTRNGGRRWPISRGISTWGTSSSGPSCSATVWKKACRPDTWESTNGCWTTARRWATIPKEGGTSSRSDYNGKVIRGPKGWWEQSESLRATMRCRNPGRSS